MTVADQIMAYMESRTTSDPVFKPELVRATGANSASISWSLTQLIEQGKLERAGFGQYRLPAADGDAPTAEPTAEPTDLAEGPEPLAYSLWHDGEMVIKCGDATIVLTAPEVDGLAVLLAPRAS